MAVNPFRPTAGSPPPVLVGRDEPLAQYAESIENGVGAPHLLLMVTGVRGIGKTVMLSELGDVALRAGWVVIHEAATGDFPSRIEYALARHCAELGLGPRAQLTGVGLSGATLTWDKQPGAPPQWPVLARTLLEELQRRGTGLTITLDEVHSVSREQLRDFTAQIQLLIRDSLPISLICAGLPKAIEDLLNDEVSTFLRRAERVHLGKVDIDLIRESLEQTFAESGRTLSDASLTTAAEATGGYPFMIQLVGYYVWRLADDDGSISPENVERGITQARGRLGSLVHATALADLSHTDRTFLAAMAMDDGPSNLSDIAARMQRSTSFVSVYRHRLISAGMIQPEGWGMFDFTLPYLREYLREHAVSLLMPDQAEE